MEVDDVVTSFRKFDDNLDDLKMPWESSCHWEARKKFLSHNWNKYEDKDRLISMSNVWHNVNVMGNRYTAKVMCELEDMEKGMVCFDDLVNAAENGFSNEAIETKTVPSGYHDSKKLPRSFMALNFVKSSTIYDEEKVVQPPAMCDTKETKLKNCKRVVSDNCLLKCKDEEKMTSKSSFVPEKGNQLVKTMTDVTKNFKRLTAKSPELIEAVPLSKTNDFSDTNLSDTKRGKKPGQVLTNSLVQSKPNKNSQNYVNVEEDSKSKFSNQDSASKASSCSKTKKEISKIADVLLEFSAKLSTLWLDPNAFELISPFSNVANQLSTLPKYVYGSIKQSQYRFYQNWIDQCGLQLQDNNFFWSCDLYLMDAFISQGYGQSKQQAKAVAVQTAVKVIRSSFSITTAFRQSTTDNSNPVMELVVTQQMHGGVDEQPGECPPIVPLRQAPVPKKVVNAQPKIRQSVSNPKVLAPVFKRPVNEQAKNCEVLKNLKLKHSSKTKHGAVNSGRVLEETQSAKSKGNKAKSLNELVLVIDKNTTPLHNLMQSASMSKVDLKFSKELGLDSDWTIAVLLNGMEIASATGAQPNAVKQEAGERALKLLKQTHPVLVKAKRLGNIDEAVSLNTEDPVEVDQALMESNIGNKLLRKMGWSGTGGLGKKEDGIVNPVVASRLATTARNGLGFCNSNAITFKNAELAIREYIQAGCTGELTFSSELTSDERKVIHNLTRKYHLKSRSFGNVNRHLVVYKDLSILQIFRQLSKTGGELNGYVLATGNDVNE